MTVAEKIQRGEKNVLQYMLVRSKIKVQDIRDFLGRHEKLTETIIERCELLGHVIVFGREGERWWMTPARMAETYPSPFPTLKTKIVQ